MLVVSLDVNRVRWDILEIILRSESVSRARSKRNDEESESWRIFDGDFPKFRRVQLKDRT